MFTEHFKTKIGNLNILLKHVNITKKRIMNGETDVFWCELIICKNELFPPAGGSAMQEIIVVAPFQSAANSTWAVCFSSSTFSSRDQTTGGGWWKIIISNTFTHTITKQKAIITPACCSDIRIKCCSLLLFLNSAFVLFPSHHVPFLFLSGIKYSM